MNRKLTFFTFFFLLLMTLRVTSSPPPHLLVHFIDVGQADSILIQTPAGENVLVDGGNNDDGLLLVSYLKSAGVSQLTAVVATHPHEDHIGGLDVVLSSFVVERFYMPKVAANTATFNDLITAVKNSSATRIQAKAGVDLKLKGVSATFISPASESYEEINDYSAVLRLRYGETSFLLTGDAGKLPESEMIQSGIDLSATVLKVGHHGSTTASSHDFLKNVHPKYAIISVGTGNTYGHPHKETLAELKLSNITIYRTDSSGTIIADSDGRNLTIKTTKITPKDTASSTKSTTVTSIPKKPTVITSTTVYITRTGEKYHVAGCRYLARSEIPISIADAKSKGYTPCSVCGPPK